MKKISIFGLINSCFRLFIIFLIFFIWFRYFINNLILCLFVSISCSIFCDYLIKILFKRKKYYSNKSIEKNSAITNTITSLIFYDNKKLITFFYNLCLTKHNATKKNKYIIINNSQSIVVLYPFFSYREMIEDDLISIINCAKKENPTKIIICASKVNQKVYLLANKLPQNTIILDGYSTYNNLFVPYNTFPETIKFIEDKPNRLKNIINYSINKKRTKSYFLSSLILLFSSYFVRYKLYYIIISSFLLIMSFFCFYNPQKEVNETELLN